MATGVTNWAGNYAYRAAVIHEPATIDELRAFVARATSIHALGSRHCFNDIADAAELVSQDRIDPAIEIDREARTVTTGAAVRYGVLAQALEREGLALHAMASLPHISVGGAVATATHGSGDANGNLATAVSAIELVTGDGDIIHLKRGDDDFAGAVVGVGALGVVTRLTLDVQPSYQVQQQIFEGLEWETLFAEFDRVTSAAESVSLFTDYSDAVGQLWLKTRVDPEQPKALLTEFLGAPAATKQLHPVPTISPDNCTDQLGVPGSWADRLPHFRMDAVPASGDEIQSEHMVARDQAIDALRAVLAHAPEIRPHLWTSEIRTVKADDLWLSSAYGTDTVCIHFSFRNRPEQVDRLVQLVEEVLAPFSPRPHWGKLFFASAGDLRPRYARMADFHALARKLDPRGKFRSAFLNRHVFGE